MHHIRNFCIIAHIDHGKSTLADRLLELTGTIEKREMREQGMDQMDLERERGITIKAKAVRMEYHAPDGQTYQLNLIDTPGHVDFTYEVSRSLAACEGAILVVDASQGIQAQTLANVYYAMEQDLAIIPVINKIDLPNARPEEVAQAIEEVLGFPRGGILQVSAREGTGVPQLLQAIIERLPPPRGDPGGPLRALIFDSKYDPYKGVVAYVRVVDGEVRVGERLRLLAYRKDVEALEVGFFRPGPVPAQSLKAGEVGYVATGLKAVDECPVGDTITTEARPAQELLQGYRPAKPMVFAGLYPIDPGGYQPLREALEKLKLNDASLAYEPEQSSALGFGFRCGFLGLLHLDIVRERLEREFGLALLVTAPSVAFQVLKRDGSEARVESPSALPPPQDIQEIREPWMAVSIVTPSQFIGAVMELATGREGESLGMEYLGHRASPWERVLLKYEIPLRTLLADFYDQLKSRTQGYASMDYVVAGYRPGRLVKLEVLVHNQPVDALSRIIPRGEAHQEGKALVTRLRKLIPRQLFDVAIQAAVEGRVIARETVKAMRKDVIAKCYGGDVTRKRKLLQKQAEGKKKLKRIGQVEVPQEAFMEVLKKT